MLTVDEMRIEVEMLERALQERATDDRSLRRRLAAERRQLSVACGTHFVVLTCATKFEGNAADDDPHRVPQISVEVYGVCEDEKTKAHGLRMTLSGLEQADIKLWPMGGDTVTLTIDRQMGPVRFTIHESDSGWTTLYTLSVHLTREDAEAHAAGLRAELAKPDAT